MASSQRGPSLPEQTKTSAIYTCLKHFVPDACPLDERHLVAMQIMEKQQLQSPNAGIFGYGMLFAQISTQYIRFICCPLRVIYYR